MRISFIYMTNNLSGDEHLGTASIAAYLEKNNISVKLQIITFDLCYNIDNIYKQIPKDIDIIGFPFFNTNAKLIYDISSKLKEEYPDILISVGGPLATDMREIIFDESPDIDFIVLGDGEDPYLEVVFAKQMGKDITKIPSILTRYDENSNEKTINITDVTKIPWVSRQYLEQMIKRGYGTARIYAGRGCCAHCSFCSHNNYTKQNSKRWRGREIEDVFNEIIHIHKRYNIVSFTFNDGSFEDPGEMGKKRIRTFCNLVRTYPYRLHFWCFLRADTFKEKDLPLIRLMRAVGFTEVFIGIESQNETDLEFYKKRATKQDNILSLKLFKQCGINVLFGFIMFNPVSSIQSLKGNYTFLKEVKNWRPHAYVGHIAVYYKTAAQKECEKLGLLTDDYSYLNPYGYKFASKEVGVIWEFVKEHLLNSIVIKRYDLDMFYFNNYFFDFLALFPKETIDFQEDFQFIMNEAADILSDYFYHILYRCDLKLAKQELPKFERYMTDCINKMNSLKLKMIYKEPFRSYIRKFSRHDNVI